MAERLLGQDTLLSWRLPDCWRCRIHRRPACLESCLGPGVFLVVGIISLAVLFVRR